MQRLRESRALSGTMNCGSIVLDLLLADLGKHHLAYSICRLTRRAFDSLRYFRNVKYN